MGDKLNMGSCIMVGNQIPRAAKRFLMYILVFIVLQGLFIMSNMAAQLIPREPIERHLVASSESPLLAYAGDHSHKVFGSDVSFDNNVFIGAIALQEAHANPFETSVRATIDVPSASFVNYDYFRYWHGWQLLTDACLYFGTIEFLQVVVLVLSVAASVAYTVQLFRCIGIVPALLFGILLLFSTNLFGNFMGDILLSISFFAALGICAGIIFAGRRRASGTSVDNSPVFLLCMVCGAVFNFLDFLTVPSMVLGLVVFSILVPMQAQGLSSGTSIGVRKLLFFVRH